MIQFILEAKVWWYTNYLIFQPIYWYFKRVLGVSTGNCMNFWKSKGLSDENSTAPTTSDYSLNPQVILVLKQDYNLEEVL